MNVIVIALLAYLVFAPIVAVVLSLKIASRQDDEIRDLKKKVEDFTSRERVKHELYDTRLRD